MAVKGKGFSAAARRKARKFALQAFYQMQMTHGSAAEVEAQFIQEYNMRKSDSEYFHELLSGVEQNMEELDSQIVPCLDRSIDELDPIETAILRMGAYELIYRLDVPFKVVINEHIELARSFGATDGHKYVNSILDKLAKQFRVDEAQGNILRS